ncbi:hypothetical protein GGQ90_002001 [Sphingobium scionense]|uniref:Uncharacterized protein n=1 Tax=Sphingobium scionense TaxID=1404341 RepID=A0A7W6LRU3_9SPHN|nr:hypothetical protein [Sphingobium scionense]
MGLRKGGLDVRYDAFEISHHIGIGKSQDLIAMCAAIFCTLGVMGRAEIVAFPIQLDDELEFSAQEIGEIGADRHLAAELVAEFLAAKLLP